MSTTDGSVLESRSGSGPKRGRAVLRTTQLVAATLVMGLASIGVAELPAAAATEPNISAGPNMVVGEASGTVDVPVTLSASSTSPVTVNYSVPGNGCNDWLAGASGTLTFTPGQTSKFVPVTVNNCGDPGTQWYDFTLSGAANGVIVNPTTVIGIVGDANQQATPGLYMRDAVVDNSAGSISVPVLLGGMTGATSASTVTVNYSTTNGSAVAGTDYTKTSGTLTFNPGQTVQNINVPILDRSGAAPTRSFTIALTSPNNAVITEGTGVVTIGASGGTTASSPKISAPPHMVVGEADGYIDLPVTLSAPSTNTVTVNYSVPGNGCNDWLAGAGGTLTFTPGETTQVVRVAVNNCGDFGTQWYDFSLSGAANGVIVNPTTVIGLVGDSNQQATPGLYVRDAVVDNSAGSISVPVLLGGMTGATSASTVTVNYTTTNGSAVAGTDYTKTSGTLTFGPGQTVQNINVPILDRSGAAPTRSFAVTLSSPNNAVITEGTGVVTIGASGGTTASSPKISAPPNMVVGEADGYIDLPVTLSAPSTNTVTVNYSVPGNGCNDWLAGAGGTLTFTPGETTQVVRVAVNNCGDVGTQWYDFSLSGAANGVIVNPTTVIGLVGDGNLVATPGLYVRDAVVDNSAGSISVPVLLGGPRGATSASTVTVNYTTTNGSAVAGMDYTKTSGTLTFGPGQTVQNINVPILDRSGAAPTRSFAVTLSSPNNAVITEGTGVVTIGASGGTTASSPKISAPPNMVVGEADGYIDLPVTLSAPSTNTVTVNYSVPGNGCNDWLAGASGTLTFTPGETTQVVRVAVNNCGDVGTQWYDFSLSGAANGVIVNPTTVIGLVGDGNLVATPGLYVRDAVVDNSAGSISVPVVLGGPGGATSASTVTVKYTTTDGSALAGTDYTKTSGTLTFGPGETVQNINVPILDRSGAAPTRSFAVTLSSPNNAVITDGTGVVTIGASGGTTVSSPNISAPPNLVVGEADGYIDLPVTLSAPSTNTVTVNYNLPGNGCNDWLAGASGTLTFTPGETTQVVRVAVNNCGGTGTQTFTFTLSGAVHGVIARTTSTVKVVSTISAPGAPTGVTAVAGIGSATVSFKAPASDGGNPINKYTVTSSPGGITATGVGSPITVTGLTSGTSYTFTVTATSPGKTSKSSVASNSVTPS